MEKHSKSQYEGIGPEEIEKLKREGLCKFCDEIAYKSNGKSELICRNRAETGKCEGHLPYVHKKQPQQRNDLCECGSGKKFKKCCIKT